MSWGFLLSAGGEGRLGFECAGVNLTGNGTNSLRNDIAVEAPEELSSIGPSGQASTTEMSAIGGFGGSGQAIATEMSSIGAVLGAGQMIGARSSLSAPSASSGRDILLLHQLLNSHVSFRRTNT